MSKNLYLPLIIIGLFFFAGCSKAPEVGSDQIRKQYVDYLNSQAIKMDTNSEFTLDPNNSKTLCLKRNTMISPDQVGGAGDNWVYLILSITEQGDTKELKSKGFTAVRIYTNVSKDLSDYSLRIIP